MALEKRLFAVAPKLFTADAGADGKVTISNASDFKVKQKVNVSGTALDQLQLEVKRIISDTVIFLGPETDPITSRTDLSAYTVAAASFIFAGEQRRPSIPFEESTRAVYEEEPTVAWRTMQVDKLGNPFGPDNPLSVQLSDGNINIGTVNAELEVQLSHQDNVPDAGDVADSVQIGDGTNKLVINADGTISDETFAPEHFNGNVSTAGTPQTIVPGSTDPIKTIFVECNSTKHPDNSNGINDAILFSIDGGITYVALLAGESIFLPGEFTDLRLDTNSNGTFFQVILWS